MTRFATKAEEALGRWPLVVPVGLVVLFALVKLYGFQYGWLNIHGARDVERGWELLHGQRLWLNGPEMSFGGSTPGWFLYFFLGLFQIPARNPLLMAALPALFFAISVGFVYDAARRFFLPATALAVAVLYGVFPFGTFATRYIWNPAFIFFFSSLVFWAVAVGLSTKRPGWFALALLAALLTAQLHISGFCLAVAVVVFLLATRYNPGKWPLLSVLGVYLLIVGPYFIYEIINGWPDQIRLTFQQETGEGLQVFRIGYVETFLSVVGLQLFVKPDWWPELPPFEYYSHYYAEGGRRAAALGWVLFVLSIGLLKLLLAGIWMVIRYPKERSCPFLLFAMLAIVITCLPMMVWNPLIAGAEDIRHPPRYFFVFWPAQFFLVGGGIVWLRRYAPRFFEPVTRAGLPAFVAAYTTFALGMTWHFVEVAKRDRVMFRYTTEYPGTVRPIIDKMSLAHFLVEYHGVDEGRFLSRVHADRKVFIHTEEDLIHELRWALETATPGEPSGESYFFLYDSRDAGRIEGNFTEISRAHFGTLGVLEFVPDEPLDEWQPDVPVGWWWY